MKFKLSKKYNNIFLILAIIILIFLFYFAISRSFYNVNIHKLKENFQNRCIINAFKKKTCRFFFSI